MGSIRITERSDQGSTPLPIDDATIARVSTAADGAERNRSSRRPAFSADGTGVAPHSLARNPVARDKGGTIGASRVHPTGGGDVVIYSVPGADMFGFAHDFGSS